MPAQLEISPARALDAILHGPAKAANPDIVLLDYRDPATFSALWLEGLESGKVTIGEQPEIDLSNSTKQFLIIGNDPPGGIFDTKIPALAGINFRSHFTATSWLAAWKVKFSPTQKEIDEKEAVVACTRFAVVDPRPTGLATGAAQSLQTLFSARDAEGLPLVPGATVLNTPNLKGICQWLKPQIPDRRTLAEDVPHLRELLKSTIWNELISNREQHHALSNVLGPMILSGKEISEKCFDLAKSDEKDDNKEQQTAASDRVSLLLRQLLSACGLVSWNDKKSGDKEPRPSETGEGLNILLLDDQAEQGWQDWVKECLPDAEGTMKVAVDPTDLVDAITKALSDDQGNLVHKDARFSLDLPGLGAGTSPVLLLDLRLFSGNPDDERKFLKNKLLPLVNHYTDKPDLAWPGFSSEDKKKDMALRDAKRKDKAFRDAKAAVIRGKLKPDTDQHHEVLTWLPRVVALADMSLPIILFSSTGRRDLVEPFKAYGNIITTFQKPRLADLAASGDAKVDIRTVTKSMMGDALGQARFLLALRDKCYGIKQLADVSNESLNELNSLYVELYIDEDRRTTNKKFAVGGMFAAFTNKDHADEFEDLCVEKGLRYFEDKLFSPNANKALLKHENKGFFQLTQAVNQFRTDEKFVELGVVRLERGNLEEEGHPLQDDTEDLRYWRMLEAVVEFFCCETLPCLKRQFQVEIVSFAVYVGTRMVPFPGSGDFSYRGSIDVHRFRSDEGRQGMLRSMGERDALPIVLKCLELHPSLCAVELDRAAALALPYKGEKKYKLDRVIHRPMREIFEFEPTRDVDIQLTPPCAAYGRIVQWSNQSLYVSVRGIDRDVYCRRSESRNFDDLSKQDPVSLEIEQDHIGFNGKNIMLVNEEALEDWLNRNRPSVSADFLSGRSVNDFRPDYRALHYTADQILRMPAKFNTLIPENRVAGQFDEDYTPSLTQVLLSSRLIDCGETGSALKQFPTDGKQVQKGQRPPARSWVASRLWGKLAQCSGIEYLKGLADCGSRTETPGDSETNQDDCASTQSPAASDVSEVDSDDSAEVPRPESQSDERPGIELPTPPTPTTTRSVVAEKWLIKNFSSENAYRQTGKQWDGAKGFYLRKDGTRYRVFANMPEVDDRDLAAGFAPLKDSPRNDDGELPGEAWSPDDSDD